MDLFTTVRDKQSAKVMKNIQQSIKKLRDERKVAQSEVQKLHLRINWKSVEEADATKKKPKKRKLSPKIKNLQKIPDQPKIITPKQKQKEEKSFLQLTALLKKNEKILNDFENNLRTLEKLHDDFLLSSMPFSIKAQEAKRQYNERIKGQKDNKEVCKAAENTFNGLIREIVKNFKDAFGLTKTTKQKIVQIDVTICPKCGSAMEKELECTSFCSSDNCQYSITSYITNVPTFEDCKGRRFGAKFQYLRMNHFRSFIRNKCAISSKAVPREIERVVIDYVDRNRGLKRSDVDSKLVRRALKQARMGCYYATCETIAYALNNEYNAMNLTDEMIGSIAEKFTEIETAFFVIKDLVDPTRKSMGSYQFITYRIAEQLKYESMFEHLDMLKSDDLMYKQDLFYKHICDLLEWQYTPPRLR